MLEDVSRIVPNIGTAVLFVVFSNYENQLNVYYVFYCHASPCLKLCNKFIYKQHCMEFNFHSVVIV